MGVFNDAAPTLRIGKREHTKQAVTFTSAASPSSLSGKFRMTASGNIHEFEFTLTQSTGTLWNHAQGLDLQKPQRRRGRNERPVERRSAAAGKRGQAGLVYTAGQLALVTSGTTTSVTRDGISSSSVVSLTPYDAGARYGGHSAGRPGQRLISCSRIRRHRNAAHLSLRGAYAAMNLALVPIPLDCLEGSAAIGGPTFSRLPNGRRTTRKP
jgi:hypothetical protein